MNTLLYAFLVKFSNKKAKKLHMNCDINYAIFAVTYI